VALADQLAAFRAAHPPRTFTHRGVAWRYYRGGTAQPTLVLLTGVLGIAELGFQVQTLLEQRHTVIAADYPDLAAGPALIDGLIAIIDREKIGRAVWQGGSFGGLILQRLVEQAPDRVAGMVLSHTGLVTAGRAPQWALRLLEILPDRWVEGLLRRRLRGLLVGAPDFWLQWFDRAIGAFDRDAIIRRVQLSNSLARMPPGPAWTGPTLIVESDNDPAVRPAARAALRAAFPHARVHTFEGTGHAAAILDPQGTAKVVAEFAESLRDAT